MPQIFKARLLPLVEDSGEAHDFPEGRTEASLHAPKVKLITYAVTCLELEDYCQLNPG